MVGRDSGRELPKLRADLLLVHPPAFHEFRGRRDLYFPFMGTTGDVPITPLYEIFPLGFKQIQRYLRDRGRQVEIVNLSTLLLRFPEIDLVAFAGALDVKVLGLDLHWMVTVQGCLAVAQELKRLRPDIPLLLGGISATYYASELIQLPFVDMVMRGYDTLDPLGRLLDAVSSGSTPAGIPNLMWKSSLGKIHDNGFTHQPSTIGCGIDWSDSIQDTTSGMLPIREILSHQNAGCSNDCGWCGGSRDAVQRICGREVGVVRKSEAEVAYEFGSMGRMREPGKTILYASGAYNQTKGRLAALIDHVGAAGLKSVNYEQFHLPSDDVLGKMVAANAHTSITLSPESHDLEVARLAGRGVYTNHEMEAWIGRALERGINRIDLWYFIGMPKQDECSVRETVDYCEYLLEKFQGQPVMPMVCPMMPFLDPASTFFESPEAHGYRVFARSAEDHRRIMTRASPIHRMNYETRWLDRSAIFTLGLRGIRDVMRAKARWGAFSGPRVEQIAARIDDAVEFTRVLTAAEDIDDPSSRARELEALGDEIERRNELLLNGGVIDQIFPLRRAIGGRWVDELGWEEQAVLDWRAMRQGTVHA